MKTKAVLIVTVVAAALQFAPMIHAQGADDQGFRRNGRHARFLANLSPDERAKLKAANQKAMADPTLQAAKERRRQANREFRQLRRQKMIEADPSVQPILDKIQAERRGNS
jgi:tripartite-type tricarboxylate transporter receptor subunit TctC